MLVTDKLVMNDKMLFYGRIRRNFVNNADFKHFSKYYLNDLVKIFL